MARTAVVHARVEPALKRSAEAVLHRLGLSTTDVFNMLLHQVVLNKGIPFEVRIPNATTRQALRDLKAKRGMKTHASVKDLMKEIKG